MSEGPYKAVKFDEFNNKSWVAEGPGIKASAVYDSLSSAQKHANELNVAFAAGERKWIDENVKTPPGLVSLIVSNDEYSTVILMPENFLDVQPQIQLENMGKFVRQSIKKNKEFLKLEKEKTDNNQPKD